MHTNAVRRKRQEEITIPFPSFSQPITMKRQEEITIPFPSFSQPITMNTNINHIERDHQVNLPEEQRAQYNIINRMPACVRAITLRLLNNFHSDRRYFTD